MGGRSKTLHQSAMTEDPEGFSTLNLQCRSILVSERILSRRVQSASNLDSNSGEVGERQEKHPNPTWWQNYSIENRY